jgi:2-hydroxy-6-oxonona-2,4-dienedioate hydrolase
MSEQVTESSTSRWAQTKKWKIHYNEAGAGHPLILLHGSGAGATGWSNFSPNIGPLSAKYRVLAVDMPGWGQSDAVTADERDHAEATIQLMDELGIEKAALVGNSMGGMTAIRVASKYPDRVSHLITMGPGATGVRMFGAGDGPTEGLKILLQAYRDPSVETMQKLVSIMTYDPAFASAELAQARSDAARARPEHLANFLAAGFGAPGTLFTPLEDLRAIGAPTLLMHGRDDRVVHYENSLLLVSAIPNSRLVLFNRCGHWAQLEHAAEFNRLVDQFVSSN